MLNCARDAAGDIQIRSYHPARLTHLVAVRYVSAVDGRTARTHGRAQDGGQVTDQSESLLGAPDLRAALIELRRRFQAGIVRNPSASRYDDARVRHAQGLFGDLIAQDG